MREPEIKIGRLREQQLDTADRVFRLAFGSFLRLPDPMRFGGDADYVRCRWRADPNTTFAAENQGELVGSNFATRWGSVGLFGPLSVHPHLWNQGVAKQLLAATMDLFATWQLRHS